MELLLAGLVTLVAVVAWTAWESRMAVRLRHDRRPLPVRNAAVAGAQRLSVVGNLGLGVLAVALAGLVQVPLWWSPVAVAEPVVGVVATSLLALAAVAVVVWAGRRNPRPRERRALLVVVATALSTELLLRGLVLALLDASGWPVTAAVLVAAVVTGVLQAWRAAPGSRTFGFVLATVLGFALGLVVVLTGSVLAAAAIHVVVAALGLVRTVPVAASAHGEGCACGGHDHGTTSTAVVGAADTDTDDREAGATGAAGATDGVAQGRPAGRGEHDHASCGSTCDHAGTSACASCPLSAARV